MVERFDQRESLFAAAVGVTAVAGSYVATGWSRSFVVAPIDQWIVNTTPGPIVTFMIENVGEEAHLLHIGMALGIAVWLFGLLSIAGLRVAERVGRPAVGVAVAGVGAWLCAFAVTGEPVRALGPAVPTATFTAVGCLQLSADGFDPARRQALGSLAAAVGFVGTALASGRLLHGGESLSESPNARGVSTLLEESAAKSLDIESDDLTGLVSSIDEFYNVSISQFDPEVPAEEWSLTLTGAVDSERTITYDELTEHPVENRFITLRCVGEKLNDKMLDTAVWTGTPIRPLLESVDPQGTCDCAMLYGEDGYRVGFPVDVLADGFLAWGMNGMELPTSHGYPVRVLIPGHWGKTNAKWLTKIELREDEMSDYWEMRGWEGNGPVKTVTKLWDEGITELDDGRIELAGHAYAGTRGIERVEVSVDGGDSWVDANLSEPLPDEDVWRQWRYTFDPEGTHEVVVRAVDGEGNQQPREESGPFPSGASGWVHRTVEP